MKSLFTLMVCLALLLSTSPALPTPVQIKFAHTCPESSPVGQGAIFFQKMVESHLRDKVKIEIYPDNKTGPTNQIIKELQHGEIQMASIPLYELTKFSKKYKVFELPFVFEDEGAVTRFQNSPTGRSLLDLIENQEYKGLDFWYFSMRQFLANKPLLHPSDARGLKFGVLEATRMRISDIEKWKYKAIDAFVTPIPIKDLYNALTNGKIDGFESTWPMISQAKLYEAGKYISVTNHAYVGFMLTTNASFWNILPRDIQEGLKSIIPEVTKHVNRLTVENSYNTIMLISKLKPDSVKVLTPEERNQWRESMKPVWDITANEIGRDLIQAAIFFGSGGGGDPCPLGTCRCQDRSCEKDCCY